MNRPARSLARSLALTLAAVLALGAIPAPARAHDGRDDQAREHGCREGAPAAAWSRPIPPPPADPYVAYAPAPPAPGARAWEREDHGRARWRGFQAERWELRRAYHELGEARARFEATWDGNPWRRDRFEHWYAARRAQLDARWYSLASWR